MSSDTTTNIRLLLKQYEDLIKSNEQTILELQKQNQFLKSQSNTLLEYAAPNIHESANKKKPKVSISSKI